jgi:UDP:flavonoid glycosyltransferase YjiC (YdhE family)
VSPFIEIGRRLKARGHRVSLITHFGYEEIAKRAALEFVAIDSPQEYRGFIADQHLLNDPRGVPEFIRRHSLSKIVDHSELIAQACQSRNTVLVTRDLFDTAIRLTAEKSRLPLRWIFGFPSQATTWKLRQQMFSDVLRPDINRARAALGLHKVVEGDARLEYPSGAIGLWPEWFAKVEFDLPFKVTPVGFFRDDDGHEGEIPGIIQNAINKSATAILITAGTGMYIDAEFYAASAEACRLLNVLGILVAQHKEQLPGDYLGCIGWVGYVPFGKLMPQVKLVIHHGGMGTLGCAMAAGVPQLVLPKGADRPDNASHLKKLRIAEFLPPPKWQPAIIADAMLRLLRSPEVGANCRTLAARLKNTDGAASACELIEQHAHA